MGIYSYYPTYDGNGNISEYLNADGTTAAHFEYDAFGNTVVTTNPSGILFTYRFSTKPIEPLTGLYYYGYRWYDPLTGRWPSRDPIEERGGVNLYGFVGNDGVDEIDIFGLKESHFQRKNREAKEAKEAQEKIENETKENKTSEYPTCNDGAIAAVHKTGTEALSRSKTEFLVRLKNAIAAKKPFEELAPTEYGGRVCAHCDPRTNILSYYTTIIEGTRSNKIVGSNARGTVFPMNADPCKEGDKLVGLWHTHPGDFAGDDSFNRGGFFSDGDINVANGYTNSNTGKHENNINNPEGVPIYMTRNTKSHGKDNETETLRYQNKKSEIYDSNKK